MERIKAPPITAATFIKELFGDDVIGLDTDVKDDVEAINDKLWLLFLDLVEDDERKS